MPWVNSSSTKQTLYKSATFSLQNRSRYWKMNLRGLRKVIIINWPKLLSKLIRVMLVARQKLTKIRSWPQLLRMSKHYQRSRTMLNSNNKVSRATLLIIAQRSQHRETSNNRSWVTTSDKTKKWATLNYITSRSKDNRRKRVFSISNPLKMPWKSRVKLEVPVRINRAPGTTSNTWLSKIICQPWIILKIVASTQCSRTHNQGMPIFLRANLRLRQIISRRVSMAQIKNLEEVASNKLGEYKIRLKLETLSPINIARPSKSSKTLKKWCRWTTSSIRTRALTKSRINLFNQATNKTRKLPWCKTRRSINKAIWEVRPKRWKTIRALMLPASLDKLFKPRISISLKSWVQWPTWIPRRNDLELVWILRSKMCRWETKIWANRALFQRSKWWIIINNRDLNWASKANTTA